MSESDPIPLHLVTKPSVADEVKENVCQILREVLVRAERGEINTLVLIGRCSDGTWFDRTSATNHYSEAIGQLEITKQDWIRQYLDKSRG